MFDRNFIYPQDHIGPYIELSGIVVKVGEYFGQEDVSVSVETDKGVFTGYHWFKHLPSVGYEVRIRIYDAGGGWYPDNRIVGWRKKEIEV